MVCVPFGLGPGRGVEGSGQQVHWHYATCLVLKLVSLLPINSQGSPRHSSISHQKSSSTTEALTYCLHTENSHTEATQYSCLSKQLLWHVETGVC